MTRDYTASDEAKATRAARRALQRRQADDPLAHREQTIAQWKRWAEMNPAHRPHRGAWHWPFFAQPWGRRYLMPGVRALLDARDAEWDRRYYAEMRATAEAWRAKKEAARAARSTRPQGQLFEEMV